MPEQKLTDPYQTLGVPRDATDPAIHSAYRKLAKTHHPDVNPGKKGAEEKFKEIAAAYALLSDKEKRERFDRGEIDASGAEKPPPQRSYYRDFGDDMGRTKYRADGGVNIDERDFDSIFENAFRAREQRRNRPRKGQDMRYALSVEFLDAAKGAVRHLTLPDGNNLNVTIPAGLKDGQVLRLKGKGQPGWNGGPAGDALIEVNVAPHPFFRRDGNDVIVNVPITLQEAVLGAKIEVPTITGPVTVTVPPNATNGQRLRLRGRGITGGNQAIVLTVSLPTEAEPELAEFLEGWTPEHPSNPRDKMVKP